MFVPISVQLADNVLTMLKLLSTEKKMYLFFFLMYSIMLDSMVVLPLNELLCKIRSVSYIIVPM